ncbi:MAG: cytochrome c family protein [Cyanobacteria bacterium REEB65]|nr:cytochrome c family protein [Cyanobacteria bacterium REEB65]
MNRNLFAVLALIFVGLGGLVYFMYSEHAHETGWSVGPAHAVGPVQPIAFSHRIHVGIRGISCTYCHQFVDKSEIAGIPPMQTCLACHKNLDMAKLQGDDAIRPDQEKAEIAKFMVGSAPPYALKDPDHGVRWLRVYDIPDHVHFPHKVHIWALATRQGKAPETTCILCHGDIAKMDRVGQFSGPYTDLSRMGTCLTCHHKFKASTDCFACHK